MLRRVYNKLANEGPRGLASAALRRIWPMRADGYPQGRDLVRGKVGLEIGGPSHMFRYGGPIPLYSAAARVDNCNFGTLTVWEGAIQAGDTFRYRKWRAPGRQYIAEAVNLARIPACSYDFVLSSHSLEHVANPLLALQEWRRVLKTDGTLVLVLPHRDGTFDHRRPVTSLSHLIEDFERGTGDDDLTHLDEILRLHDFSLDPGSGDVQSFQQRSMRNIENRCLHHHVFDTNLAVELIHYAGFQILHVEAFQPGDILLLAGKLPADAHPDNAQFRRLNSKPQWSSPFPSDQLDATGN